MQVQRSLRGRQSDLSAASSRSFDNACNRPVAPSACQPTWPAAPPDRTLVDVSASCAGEPALAAASAPIDRLASASSAASDGCAGGFPFELEVEYRASQPAIVGTGDPQSINAHPEAPDSRNWVPRMGMLQIGTAWFREQRSPLRHSSHTQRPRSPHPAHRGG